ncbi:MAG: hypothetical protein RLZ44_178 [Pseudomonadota bacterium]
MSPQMRCFDRQLRELVYAAVSPIHGRGLFARRRIVAGEYIGTYWGPAAKRNGMYVLWVYESHDDAAVSGRSGRNLLRYLNHALPANAEFNGFDLYALANIAADEEITINYGDDYFAAAD